MLEVFAADSDNYMYAVGYDKDGEYRLFKYNVN